MSEHGAGAALRRFAEGWARGRRVRRTLPDGTPLYVSPDAQLKYLRGSFDEDLVALARDRVRPDSVVWDIGANCGVFAFSCGHAHQVVAVEADPFLANLLIESRAMNGSAATIVAAAVSDETGLASFSIAARGRASNHLTSTGGHSQTGGERARLMVPTVPLDTLLDRCGPPTLVKIDVEGAEAAVLRGATRLLREVRPTLYLEIAPGETATRTILEAAGYRLTAVAEMNWLAEP